MLRKLPKPFEKIKTVGRKDLGMWEMTMPTPYSHLFLKTILGYRLTSFVQGKPYIPKSGEK